MINQGAVRVINRGRHRPTTGQRPRSASVAGQVETARQPTRITSPRRRPHPLGLSPDSFDYAALLRNGLRLPWTSPLCRAFSLGRRVGALPGRPPTLAPSPLTTAKIICPGAHLLRRRRAQGPPLTALTPPHSTRCAGRRANSTDWRF